MAAWNQVSTEIWLKKNEAPERVLGGFVADRTRLELATSGLTGRRSNQLNYRSG